MGFKPLSKIKEQYYVKPASFIYPEDEVIVIDNSLSDDISIL